MVKDEISNLMLAEKILANLNYVLTAKTPSEGLQTAIDHAGEIARLVTDVIMPEMNGRELSEKIQAL